MFPSKRQYEKWTLPTKWGFVASVVGIASAVLAVVLPLAGYLSNDPKSVVGVKRCLSSVEQSTTGLGTNLLPLRLDICRAIFELQANREYLTALIDRFGALPRFDQFPDQRLEGTASAEAIRHLARKHREHWERWVYGEDLSQTIEDLARMGSDLDEMVMQGSRSAHLYDGQQFSLYDPLLISSFLQWYLHPMAEALLPEAALSTLPPRPAETLSAVGSSKISFIRYRDVPANEPGHLSVLLALLD